MHKSILFLLTVLLSAMAAGAQVVTSSPEPLQEDATDVTIFFHADRGDRGLINQPQSQPVYVHTGADVTDASGNTSSWKYAPAWGDNQTKYQLSYVSENLWKLYIGDIRQYYGVAQNETVKRLCFVFRNADNSRTGRDTGGADIFLDVVDSGFQLSFRTDASQIVTPSDNKATFSAALTQPGEITISVNGVTLASKKNTSELEASYTFATPGEYDVTCRATGNGETCEKSLSFLAINANRPAADTSIPTQGCTRNADGSYTFCIAAPQKQNAVLIGSWSDFRPLASGEMQYVDRKIDGAPFRYFKTTIPAADITGPFSYYYMIDGATAVGDPYARLVLDPQNDRYISQQVYPDMPQYPEGKVPGGTPLAYYADDLLSYKWENTSFSAPSRENLMIYELLIRDFTGTEGKAEGNGTLRGAIERIPYLKELGVNAVELLPINEFNGNISWGYNPNFYFAPDKAYGTPQDYKEFIDECHAHGMAVIIDMVFNQSDWLHPWYTMYETGKNPFFNASAPHAYSVLNDWNQGYPLVEEQWKDVVRFWLSEYRVDGFRFDLVKGLGDNDSYANNSSNATDAYNASRVARMKRIHDAMREVNPDAYFINENLAQQQEENEMAEDGELNWANYNNAGCQYAMGYQSGANLNGMNAAKGSRTPGSTVSYMESHDEQRLAYKQTQWGVTGVKDDHAAACRRLGSAAAQMILTPGSHMIWQFSELGNAQNTKTADGNDTGPKIVNWNLIGNPDNAGLYKSYCQLIKLRLDYPELFPADNSFANDCSAWDTGRTITARTADKELYCVINPSVSGVLNATVNFLSDDNSAYWIASQSYGVTPTFDAAAKKVSIPANSYAVFTTRNVSGTESLTDDDHFNITTAPGHLAVSGNTTVDVYTLGGLRAATLHGAGSVDLPAGIYIVRSGSRVIKVAVR